MAKPETQGAGEAIPTVSTVLDDGRLVELVFIPGERRTRLAVGQGEDVELSDTVALPEGPF
jgi:hypothetical protein